MGRSLNIRYKTKGKSFKKVTTYLERVKEAIHLGLLDKYGRLGVEALRRNTPEDTGKTAESWYYEIENKNGLAIIRWLNSNVNNHVNIAVIIQYGHATGTGGYVEGIDYINPVMRPIFLTIADGAWKEVVRL